MIKRHHILFSFLAFAVFLLMPSHKAEAAYYTQQSSVSSSGMIVHAKPPMGHEQLNVQTGRTDAINVTAQNVTPVAFTTPLCVEQIGSDGVMRNQGCVPEAHFTDATQGPSVMDFNAWADPRWGNSKLVFTYRAPDGTWHEMQDMYHQKQTVNYYTM